MHILLRGLFCNSHAPPRTIKCLSLVRWKHGRTGVLLKPPGGVPLLYKEKDVEEMFVRGSGSGGQSVARTSNCVVLRHVPTGIMVRCHATRSRDLNRKKARLELQLRLDDMMHGRHSFRNKKHLKKQKARRKMHARARLKHGSSGAETGKGSGVPFVPNPKSSFSRRVTRLRGWKSKSVWGGWVLPNSMGPWSRTKIRLRK